MRFRISTSNTAKIFSIKNLVSLCALCIFVTLVLLGFMNFVSTQPLSIHQVWLFRSLVQGRRVTIRGYFGQLEVQRTLMGCRKPATCCNYSSAQKIEFLQSPPNFKKLQYNDVVVVKGMDCAGNECAIRCKPIDPAIKDMVELTGSLVFYEKGQEYPIPWMTLENIEWKFAKRYVQGKWVRLATGEFETLLTK